MPADLPSTLLFFGRLLAGGAFVFAGLRNIQNAAFLTGLMAARGVPQARLALWAGIVLQVIAGALVISGLWTVIACAALVLFLVVATPMFHNFWDHQGPDRASRINGFIGNVALGGGFLTLIAQSV
ncbi:MULTISPECIES: DoxX family protein [unclassified Mesorhizobium]|uniref:DoxX family protein n=1 Tax=unclassified Mesorhizobium TaxID=325217 RepID=UPI0010939538|nr:MULTISPECIES: DoxX family protein [unclassified Mesorhizobium]TGS48300.1 DoxX family protein [Mesorhizobium sp. M8A.F.Ca.ET.182.01.1.1]TGS83410.1 DoxX family protein [Mesorhizobium sp. M8A.F.Ca.ET.181.01.1.1]